MAYRKAETWCTFDNEDISKCSVIVCVCVAVLMFTDMVEVQSKHNYVYYIYRWYT